jgi:hypothetical protein
MTPEENSAAPVTPLDMVVDASTLESYGPNSEAE